MSKLGRGGNFEHFLFLCTNDDMKAQYRDYKIGTSKLSIQADDPSENDFGWKVYKSWLFWSLQ